MPLKMRLRRSDNILGHAVYIRRPWIKECILIQEFIKQIHQVLSMVPYLPNIEPQIAYLTENLRELVLHHILILLFILSIKFIDGFWAPPMQKAPFQLLQWIWKEAAVVQLLSRVPLFVTPRNVPHQPQSSTISWSFLKFMSTELAMLFKHCLRRTQTQPLMSTIWDAARKGPMIPGLSWTFLWLPEHTCKPPPEHASHCSHPWFTGLGPDLNLPAPSQRPSLIWANLHHPEAQPVPGTREAVTPPVKWLME